MSLNAQISETDLESSHFFYQHDGSDAQIDRFSFVVTDGVHNEYIYKGKATHKLIKEVLKLWLFLLGPLAKW